MSDSSPGKGQESEVMATAPLFRWLLPLYFTHINQAILTTLPFTVAVYMVRSFESERGAAPSEAAIGRLTGLLAAVFCAAQLVTSYPWGMVADRVGRKPVMVIGNVSCVVSVLAFGLAGTYAQAVAARAVGGALNAIILAEKAILGESVPRASQAKAFSLYSLCWGLGSLAGPMIGGSLAAPCSTALRIDALCGEHSLLVTRPYFLPCLVAGLLSAVSTAMVIFMLEETLPSRRRSAPAQRDHSGGWTRYQRVPVSEHSDAATLAPPYRVGGSTGRGQRAEGEVELAGLPELSPSGSSSSGGGGGSTEWRGSNGGKAGSAPGLEVQGSSDKGAVRPFRGDSARVIRGVSGARGSPSAGGDASPAAPRSVGSRRSSLDSLDLGGAAGEQERGHLLSTPSAGAAGAVAADADAAAAHAAEAADAAAVPWHKQRPVLLSLLGYGLIAFLFNILDEVTPIFASAAVAEGGVGFSPSQLAPSLSWGGLVLVAWALYGYPWLSRRVGVVRVLRMGLWHTAPLALLTPCASLFGGATLPSQALLFVSLGFKAIAGTNAFTSCLILVNAASPPGCLGKVNGAGQSLASLVRAAGPALGGLSWAWSLQLAELAWWPAWLPHQYLPFVLVAVLALCTDLVYWDLRLPLGDDLAGPGKGSGGSAQRGDDQA